MVEVMTRLTDTDTLTICRGGHLLLHSTFPGLKAEKAQPGLEAGRLQFTSTLTTSPHSPPTSQPQPTPHLQPLCPVMLFTIPADDEMTHLIFISILTILTVDCLAAWAAAGQVWCRQDILTLDVM